MSKYFKIIEIDADEFITKTGEDLDCCQLVIPTNKAVFVTIDEYQEYEIEVPLDCFEKEIEGE